MTAVHAEYGELDTTKDDLGTPAVVWDQIHRVRPRVELRCGTCSGHVHPKESPRGLRFFAHDPPSPDSCPVRRETEDHRILKNEIARAARLNGWRAQVEARGHGWRADVLAAAPRGDRRIAWEVQLTAVRVDELVERTARYWADGIETCWVTTRPSATWLGEVPSILLAPGRERGWVVRDGHRILARNPLVRLHAVNNRPDQYVEDPLLGPRGRRWQDQTGGDRSPWLEWSELLNMNLPRTPQLTTDQPTLVRRSASLRCRIGWWKGRDHGLHKFVAGVQSGLVAAVELAGPHRDVTKRPWSQPVVWTTWEQLRLAVPYTAFALGWRISNCLDWHNPPACSAGPCPAKDCGASDLATFDGGAFSPHVCPHCQPEFADLAREVQRSEDQALGDGEDLPVGLGVPGSTLLYQPDFERRHQGDA